MVTPEVEKEKKRIFVKQSFKVIRYQLRAEKEDRRQFEKGLRGQVMTNKMREESDGLIAN